jgi:hypothetical protein
MNVMNQKISKLIFGSLVIVMLLAGTACTQGGGNDTDITLPPELPEDVDSLVMLAKFDLSLKIGANIDKITVSGVEQTDFSDASLDVPEPGFEYPAVVTPGYIIMIKFDGDTYEYHASSERVVQVPQE